jgi:hypothetical protein
MMQLENIIWKMENYLCVHLIFKCQLMKNKLNHKMLIFRIGNLAKARKIWSEINFILLNSIINIYSLLFTLF